MTLSTIELFTLGNLVFSQGRYRNVCYKSIAGYILFQHQDPGCDNMNKYRLLLLATSKQPYREAMTIDRHFVFVDNFGHHNLRLKFYHGGMAREGACREATTTLLDDS